MPVIANNTCGIQMETGVCRAYLLSKLMAVTRIMDCEEAKIIICGGIIKFYRFRRGKIYASPPIS